MTKIQCAYHPSGAPSEECPKDAVFLYAACSTHDPVARAEKAEARVAELESALLAIEHDVSSAEDAKGMHDDAIARVESVMGKPPRQTRSVSEEPCDACDGEGLERIMSEDGDEEIERPCGNCSSDAGKLDSPPFVSAGLSALEARGFERVNGPRPSDAPTEPDPWAWVCPDCGETLDQSDKCSHPEKCPGQRPNDASADTEALLADARSGCAKLIAEKVRLLAALGLLTEEHGEEHWSEEAVLAEVRKLRARCSDNATSAREESLAAALGNIIAICAPPYDHAEQLWHVEQEARAALNPKHEYVSYPSGNDLDYANSASASVDGMTSTRALECIRNRHRDHDEPEGGPVGNCHWCNKPWPCADYVDASAALDALRPDPLPDGIRMASPFDLAKLFVANVRSGAYASDDEAVRVLASLIAGAVYRIDSAKSVTSTYPRPDPNCQGVDIIGPGRAAFRKKREP